MTAAEIFKELKSLGSESFKNVLLKHGINEPLLALKVEELKKIQKRITKDYQLAGARALRPPLCIREDLSRHLARFKLLLRRAACLLPRGRK